MSALHVRDVPDETIAALRERAAAHGRSMQQEIREILQAAADEPVARHALEPIDLVTVTTGEQGTWTREEMYGDEGR